MFPTLILSFLCFLLCFTSEKQIFAAAAGGSWKLLQKNVGVSAMHMQLLNNDRVVMFDRTDFGPSNLTLPDGNCRNEFPDCTAHSIEYNVLTNKFRALTVQTNVWCSSGAVMADGQLIQTGGSGNGEKRVRTFSPCNGNCDWVEIEDGLKGQRWYATNHILPDGRQIILGGRAQFTYEFYPKRPAGLFNLTFLSETTDPVVENNLYPFVYLNVDGNLFIFANNRAISFDYVNNKVVKKYPIIPGGEARSYPSTGSSVLLPLKNLQAPNVEAEVLVCGGAANGAFLESLKGNFLPGLNTCGRIKITDANPQWVMETMPRRRVMGDMILLPDGNVVIINGADAGSAGWEQGRGPVLNPVIYRSNRVIGSRFEVQNPTTIPRMYHSAACLLRDGRVLVGGSNPHAYYNFTGVLFPTELSLEAFSPSYLNAGYNNIRPTVVSAGNPRAMLYRQKLKVRFSCTGPVTKSKVVVNLVAPSFTTHSFAQNQRLLVLGNDNVISLGNNLYEVEVRTPPSPVLAPPGFYLLYVVHRSIPGEGIWVKLQG